MSNVYLAAIIRDYLRFFIRNTAVIGNIVREMLKAEVKKVAAEKQMCIENIFNRTLRIKKLYELWRPIL